MICFRNVDFRLLLKFIELSNNDSHFEGVDAIAGKAVLKVQLNY